ncbi:uncharacterized protein LOC124165870 [Ischnura elegans]|uniref:uncharacterized protein LOC124165870 n=1 Tax=Ischnura elegans TaxID=197161 RepID=UPI001ED89C0E|nr:uncharacterized protein LOC124165870 [Ischnura elegans]
MGQRNKDTRKENIGGVEGLARKGVGVGGVDGLAPEGRWEGEECDWRRQRRRQWWGIRGSGEHIRAFGGRAGKGRATRSMRYQMSVAWLGLLLPASGIVFDFPSVTSAYPQKRAISDQTVRGYLTERTCWWNEVCKEEFQTQFRCRCPLWSYCRSPGRYYNAYCSITSTGYTWVQPEHHLGGIGFNPAAGTMTHHAGSRPRSTSKGGRSGGGPGAGVPLPSFH